MNKSNCTKGLNGRVEITGTTQWLLLMGVLFSFIFLSCTCNEDPVGPDPIFQLTVVDVGVTEAWLKITVNAERGIFSLKRNDSTIISTLHSPIDTVIYDEGLLPKHDYTYKAGEGKPLTITTMDTTSHEFTWETTVLGDGNNSVLYDVAIINDTLAYAVGEIYLRDSTGEFERVYNMAKWNGNNWQLLRVPTAMYPNFIDTFPLKTVFTFNEHDIWTFSNAGSYSYWNGSNWSTQYVAERSGGGTKLWGTSSSSLYLVGTNGSISFYNGTQWRKLESGTTTHINDAWGVQNTLTDKEEIYCPVTDGFAFRDRKILKITNTSQIDSIPWTPQREVYSIWSPNGLSLFAGGDGVFENHNGIWRQVDIGVNIYTNHIRGNALNNIFAVGPLGLISHNNGVSWKLMTGIEAGSYTSISMKEDLVIAVGTTQNSSKAFVAIGKRN